MAPTSWSDHKHFLLFPGNSHDICMYAKNIKFLFKIFKFLWDMKGDKNSGLNLWLIREKQSIRALSSVLEFLVANFNKVILPLYGGLSSHVAHQGQTGPADLDNENYQGAAAVSPTSPSKVRWDPGSPGSCLGHILADFAFGETRPTVFCLAPNLHPAPSPALVASAYLVVPTGTDLRCLFCL